MAMTNLSGVSPGISDSERCAMVEALVSVSVIATVCLIVAGLVEGWCWLTARRRWRQSADWCGEGSGAHHRW